LLLRRIWAPANQTDIGHFNADEAGDPPPLTKMLIVLDALVAECSSIATGTATALDDTNSG
jgi:hypothetical protein